MPVHPVPEVTGESYPENMVCFQVLLIIRELLENFQVEITNKLSVYQPYLLKCLFILKK